MVMYEKLGFLGFFCLLLVKISFLFFGDYVKDLVEVDLLLDDVCFF